MSRESENAFVPLAVPHLGGNEACYIQKCLETNWVSYIGSYVSEFEESLADKAGAEEAVAVTSGTAGLHISLLLAGVEPDSEVVMPGISFVAPANAVRYCGAWPTFVDIAEEDWQLDPDKLRRFLEDGCERDGVQIRNRVTGRRVSGVMIVHLLGGLGPSEEVYRICSEFGLPLVEDAAECLGSAWEKRELCSRLEGEGDGGPARFFATSFNGNKIVTTGGGGAILTNDPEAAARARHLTTTAKTDSLEFFHDELGYNLRLTNVAAAMGVAQLERLDFHVSEKRRIAASYNVAFGGDSRLRPMPEPEGVVSNFWLYTVMLDRPAMPVVEAMIANGIGCRPIWHPLADLPYLREAHSDGLAFGSELQKRAICLPCSVGLPERDQERVLNSLIDCLS